MIGHFKEPMLAVDALPPTARTEADVQAAIDKLEFPLLWSPKLDGIRALPIGGTVMSRKLKPIPNQHIQRMLGGITNADWLDGELVVGDENDPNAMQNTSSGIMSRDGEPNFTFHVFDYADPEVIDEPYQYRYRSAANCISSLGDPRIKLLKQTRINTGYELLAAEEWALTQGYEGLILRPERGRYKQGRSTYNEGLLFKWKRLVDDEAEIIAVYEQLQNNNAKTKNELGRTQRLGGKKAHTGKGILGGFTCRTKQGVVFNVGTGKGLNMALRAKLWAERETLPGEYIKFESFAATGVKDKPRFPRVKKLLGIRWKGEM